MPNRTVMNVVYKAVHIHLISNDVIPEPLLPDSPGVVGKKAEPPRGSALLLLIDSAFFNAEHDDHHLARITELIREFG